jgi:hypothetical protein
MMIPNLKSHHLNRNSGEVLKLMFRTETLKATNLTDVSIAVCRIVRVVSSREGGFAFISGIISSDGPKLIDRNMEILSESTDHVREISPKPVTSASDIFHKELLAKFRENTTHEQWDLLWKNVLDSGISQLIMTPRWDLSRGAKVEHDHAVMRGIQVDYRDDDPELLRILRKYGVET